MKILHLHAKLDFSKVLLKKIKIPGKFSVYTTIQYLDSVKKYFPGAGQILGCSNLKPEKSCLYIGTGEFHPLRIARFAENVYILNPETSIFSKISGEEINSCKKQVKGKQLRFLSAKNTGILVSTKSGQYDLKNALTLAGKYSARIFLFNTLQKDELENFPQIDCWINTACPRIEGKNIINLEDLPD